MSVRESFLTVNESLAAAPGPGHYAPGFAFHKTAGGSSLDSRVCALNLSLNPLHTNLVYSARRVSIWTFKLMKWLSPDVCYMYLQAERFPQPASKAPGPGAYSISKSTDWIRKTYPPPTNRPTTSRNTVSNVHVCLYHTYTT